MLPQNLACVLRLYIYFRILSIFNTHMGRGEKVLKKPIVVYIQKGLTLGYTAQDLNLFNSHLFSNVGLTHSLYVIYNPMMRIL